MRTNIYSIENLSFAYPYANNTLKFKGIINIKQGDVILIKGKSGSGKSTLLKILKGLIPETIYGSLKGKIQFKQEDITKLSNLEMTKIGYLFQNPNSQMLNRTVKQELAFGLENLQKDRNQIIHKIDSYAGKFDINHLLSRNVTELSGGEKQKIALISILMMEPEVLLFDEPTAFLDPDSAEHFIEIFKQIVHQKTIVIVEHNIHYLKKYVNRLFTLKNGYLTEENPTKALKSKPYPVVRKNPGNQIILQVKNLVFAYKKERKILNKLNFKLKKAEIVGIIGKNGAGKTTFLNILSRILKKYKGSIYFKGKNIKNIKKHEYYQNLTLLMQNPENHFLFNSVREEVENNKSVLARLGLENLEARNPFTLSTGEQRRLSLAILLNLAREVFLWDEPTFAQDRDNKDKLIKIILEMQTRGKTFILVSHDIAFLEAICSKIYRLENGKLENYAEKQN